MHLDRGTEAISLTSLRRDRGSTIRRNRFRAVRRAGLQQGDQGNRGGVCFSCEDGHCQHSQVRCETFSVSMHPRQSMENRRLIAEGE